MHNVRPLRMGGKWFATRDGGRETAEQVDGALILSSKPSREASALSEKRPRESALIALPAITRRRNAETLQNVGNARGLGIFRQAALQQNGDNKCTTPAITKPPERSHPKLARHKQKYTEKESLRKRWRGVSPTAAPRLASTAI